MPKSQNGWPVFESAPPKADLIPGVLELRVRPGDVAYIFQDLAQYFHMHIQRVDLKVEEEPGYDDWGWNYRKVREGQSFSNHASGTAIDLNATKHVLGKRNTFNASQLSNIRRMLRRYRDPLTDKPVVRWGGDYVNRADEMHWEIIGNTEAVFRVATKLRQDKARQEPKPEVTLALDVDSEINVSRAAQDFIQARGGVAEITKDDPTPDFELGWFITWGYINNVMILEEQRKTNQLLGQQNDLLRQLIVQTDPSTPR